MPRTPKKITMVLVKSAENSISAYPFPGTILAKTTRYPGIICLQENEKAII